MVKAPGKPPAGRKPAASAARGKAGPKPPARKAKAAAADPTKPAASKTAAPKRPPAKTPAKTAVEPAASKQATGPKGFGGWLWLLAIGQLIVTARMIDTLMKMARLVGTELWDEHRMLVIADLALYGAALALQFAVLVAMALGKRQFVPLFLASIVAFFVIGRVEPLLAIAFLGMDPAGLASRAVLLPMAIELAVGLVWGAYVLRSRRVKNTFVR